MSPVLFKRFKSKVWVSDQLIAGVRAQPFWQRSGNRRTAIQGDRLSDFIAPLRMPEEDRNQGGDIASDGKIHRVARVLDADFDGCSIQH
jgi:hypothetical protein